MQITNKTGISLPMAVWLIHDTYDYVDRENYISATKLMRPLRHLILPDRIPVAQREAPDVQDYVARALGHSIHDSVEKAWVQGYKKSLRDLGYDEETIGRVLVNPTDEQAAAVADPILVYIEQRAFRQISGYTIGGKFDMVTDGIVQDTKSTSAYSWLHGNRDDEHQLQGSIYRWLNPKKITADFIRINYIFTDWQKMMAKSNPKYPQSRVLYKDIPLLSLKETQKWIEDKLLLIEAYSTTPEPELPECTDEELWRSDPVHKYYSDPTKTSGRATKNFDNVAEANMHRAEKGKGIVITVPGLPKRCDYCEAYSACTQKDRYHV